MTATLFRIACAYACTIVAAICLGLTIAHAAEYVALVYGGGGLFFAGLGLASIRNV